MSFSYAAGKYSKRPRAPQVRTTREWGTEELGTRVNKHSPCQSPERPRLGDFLADLIGFSREMRARAPPKQLADGKELPGVGKFLANHQVVLHRRNYR
jgi:hypothetical protein